MLKISIYGTNADYIKKIYTIKQRKMFIFALMSIPFIFVIIMKILRIKIPFMYCPGHNKNGPATFDV